MEKSLVNRTPTPDSAGKGALGFKIAVYIWYFAAGADRSSVIPTVNEYLDYLGAEQFYIGLVIALFAVGSMISAPTFGRIADKIGTSRPLVLVGICLHLCGAVVYFLAPNLPGNRAAAWITFGRFLAGIGYGLDGAIMGTLTKCAKEEDRSAVISRTILLRQVGVVLGPLSVLGLRKLNFTLPGGTEINKYNSLGFVLCFLWILVMIMTFFLYHDKDIVLRSNRESPEKEEIEMLNGTNQSENGTNQKDEFKAATSNQYGNKYKWRETQPIDTIFREQIVVCLIGSFCGMFLQASLETMFTPLSKRLLGFSSTENAITYVCIGFIAVVGYFSVKYVNSRYEDRKLLFLGLTIELINTIVLLVLIPTASFRATRLFVFLVITVFLQVFFMAYLVVSSATMLSKFSPKNRQATVQGIRIGVETFSTIIAPLWIGWTLNLSFVITFSVPFVFLTLAVILLSLSFSVMEPSLIKKYS